jgi:hypothetical protein
LADQRFSHCRAVIDWLANSAHYANPTDQQWELAPDDEAIQLLQKYVAMNRTNSGKVFARWPSDPLLKQLDDNRQETAHRGPLWIKPTTVTDPREFQFGWDNTPVIDFAERVLAKLTDIQSELTSKAPSFEGGG